MIVDFGHLNSEEIVAKYRLAIRESRICSTLLFGNTYALGSSIEWGGKAKLIKLTIHRNCNFFVPVNGEKRTTSTRWTISIHSNDETFKRLVEVQMCFFACGLRFSNLKEKKGRTVKFYFDAQGKVKQKATSNVENDPCTR